MLIWMTIMIIVYFIIKINADRYKMSKYEEELRIKFPRAFMSFAEGLREEEERVKEMFEQKEIK